MKNNLHLSSEVIFNSGITRGVIIDTIRRELFYIDNSFIRILELIEKDSNESFEKMVKLVPLPELHKFFDFLVENELAFYSKGPGEFKRIDTSWEIPLEVINGIIDIDTDFSFYEKALSEFEKVDCRELQIRLFSDLDLTEFQKLVTIINQYEFHYVEIHLVKNSYIPEEEIRRVIENVWFVTNILIYGSEDNKIVRVINDTGDYFQISLGTISYLKQSLKQNGCGSISQHTFTWSKDNIRENISHNSCLNGKISVDRSGYIKNCPSMAKNFGNIASVSFRDVLNNNEFRGLWLINKDKINICKFCEYRKICTDCRAYLDNPDDIYSKPLKCGYDPFTARWEDWSTNPLKLKAMSVYGLV
ncbi:hypothetical protein GCM10028806_09490 [Spirosoma terrae]|uniref:Grasp-with-spasm system SPASM domain peptide maturase n=1 Tax=Spirosoma terrae TaxID=1968276 RepID=A0A6L9LGZ7_9BACT|nr:grasp-with-spasm system SPASM domain peptide maturase [Spirosoma terrae]NDU95909.1 grasp-with-spasm system SPASM domain peptide maturase [Spirosoma terrae]